jgi:hypothetical protein
VKTTLHCTIPLSTGYCTLEKMPEYGFKLTHYTPTTNPKAKRSHSYHETYHPNYKAVAERIAYLGLEGDSLDSVTKALASLEKTIERKLVVATGQKA